jgi:small subunit ribosomal protein S1
LSGKVTRIERFGAFVELMPGVEGLLPIGRLAAGRRLMSPREAVSEGQELDLQVESVDAARRRISLRPIEARGPGSQPGAPGADAEADDDPQQYLARHRGPAGGLGSLGDALSGLKL